MMKLMRLVWLVCAIANYLAAAAQVALMFKSSLLPWYVFLFWSIGSVIFATVNLKVWRSDEMWEF